MKLLCSLLYLGCWRLACSWYQWEWECCTRQSLLSAPGRLGSSWLPLYVQKSVGLSAALYERRGGWLIGKHAYLSFHSQNLLILLLFFSVSCSTHVPVSYFFKPRLALLHTNIRAYMWIDKGSWSVPHIHRKETTEDVFILCLSEYMVSPTLSSVRATQLWSLSIIRITLYTWICSCREWRITPFSSFQTHAQNGAPEVKYILTNVLLQVFPRRAHFESSKCLLEAWRWADKNQEEERAC